MLITECITFGVSSLTVSCRSAPDDKQLPHFLVIDGAARRRETTPRNAGKRLCSQRATCCMNAL